MKRSVWCPHHGRYHGRAALNACQGRRTPNTERLQRQRLRYVAEPPLDDRAGRRRRQRAEGSAPGPQRR